jgi:hypothetical protein
VAAVGGSKLIEEDVTDGEDRDSGDAVDAVMAHGMSEVTAARQHGVAELQDVAVSL